MRLYKRSTKPSRWTQFTSVWEQLKEVDELTISLHSSELHAVCNGIQKVKSSQQILRYQLGLIGFGRMKTKVEDDPSKPGFILLTLTLSYNGEKL